MESTRFDALVRALSSARSRRAALPSLLGGFGALLTSAGGSIAASKRKKARRRRKDRKPGNGPCGNGSKKANRCKRDNQCCTGLCEGKRCSCLDLGAPCETDASCCPRTKGMSCQEGTCQPCDVCASGCDFDTVQDAIDAASPGATIHICAGVFRERLTIAANVTLIGVGDGKNGTTIDGQRGGTTVTLTGEIVELERIRITGGANPGGSGGGILIQDTTLRMTDCTVIGNSAEDGAGIASLQGTLTLTTSRVSGNQAAESAGGILHDDGATSLFASTVTGNVAGSRGGGIVARAGAMSLFDASRVEDNTAGIEGGGIFRDPDDVGAFSLNDGIVTNNSPDNCAGINIFGCTND